MRLVVQVDADHGRLLAVAERQAHQVGNPTLFRIPPRVPQRRLRGTVGAMPVEDDAQAALPRPRDKAVHHLQAGEAAQVRVQGVIDGARVTRWVEQLVGEGQTDGVKAERAHLVEQVPPGAHAEAIGRKGAGLQAEPVDAAEPHGVALRVAQDGAVGVQVGAVRG